GTSLGSLWSAQSGCHLVAIRGASARGLRAPENAERLGMPRKASEWPRYLSNRAVTRARSATCLTFAKAQYSSARTRNRWWLHISKRCAVKRDLVPPSPPAFFLDP